MKRCVECDKQITEKRRTIYCSDKCHYLNKAKRNNPNYKPKVRLPAVRLCKHCGKSFKPRQNTNIYCTHDCSTRQNIGKEQSDKVKALRKQKDFEKFLVNLSKKANGFNYVNGYEHSESIVTLQCKQCLNHILRNAQFVRRNKKLNCEHCIQQYKHQTNQLKKKQHEIKKLIRALKKRAASLERDSKLQKVLCCKNCGVEFNKDNLKRRTFCSGVCCRQYQNKTKEVLRRKRLYKNGKVDYSITLQKLIKKYNGVCVLCNEKVILGNGYQHTLYPSIDHIIPVSKGGTHTWDNVQLAHRGCNSSKSNESIFKLEKGLLVFDL